MFNRQRIVAVALPALVMLTLSGCSLLSAPGPAPLTGTAACAQGHTWTASLEDLSTQVSDSLKASGVPVSAVTTTGELTLDWNVQGHVVLKGDYVITVTAAPAADQLITLVETHTGSATGAAYVNGEVAIPRKWDASQVQVETTANNNGAALDPLPFTVPNTTFDDSVGLELTCSGSDLTTHPRGGGITQTWTR